MRWCWLGSVLPVEFMHLGFPVVEIICYIMCVCAYIPRYICRYMHDPSKLPCYYICVYLHILPCFDYVDITILLIFTIC